MGNDVRVIGSAQREAWWQGVLPPTERLPNGIWSVPVPIPDNPLRYTLSYLVTGEHGVLVVDPGWNTDAGWAALVAGMSVAGATPSDVVGIVATHVHEDHHGLSGRLAAASGAWVAMHPAEAATLPQRRVATNGHRTTLADWLRGCGAPDDEIAEITADGWVSDEQPSMAEPDVLLHDGSIVPLAGRTVRTLWTPGHTPGHICLVDTQAQVLMTGDHLLPRITPNVGMSQGGGPTAPALANFLSSLAAVAAVDRSAEGFVALPAHEYRFAGITARVQELEAHHERRCEELLDTVGSSHEPTLWSVATKLTWARPWAEIGRMQIVAVLETAAHARYLVDRGSLESSTVIPASISSFAPDTTIRVWLPRT